MGDEEELRHAKFVLDRFVLPVDDFFPPLDAIIDPLIDFLQPPAKVFRGNLESAFTVVTIPYIMAYSAALQTRFNSLLTAERIRGLKTTEDHLPKEAEFAAFERASERMDGELKIDATYDHLRRSVVRNLYSISQRGDVGPAAQELLRETVVMIWGAFEVFITDTLKSLVNVAPGIAVRLLTGDTKKHFPSKGISIEALADRNFNVTSAMGNVLFNERHLDALPVIKDVLNCVFLDDPGLRTALDRPELYLLAQRRHLIVHRRGEIDAAYIARTGDRADEGARLQLTTAYIYDGFLLIRDAAIAMLKAAERFPDSKFVGSTS